MTSYISTQSLTLSLQQSILQLQSQLASSENELTTGNYADPGAALGARTGEIVSLASQQSLLQTISDTSQAAATRLSTTQNVLSNLQSSAQSLLNALIQDSGTNSNASAIQASAQSNLKSLISSLNTTLNGACIFAGSNTGTPPITDYYAPGSASKAAVDAAFSGAFGMTQTSASVSTISESAMKDFLDNQFAPLFQDPSWATIWSSASAQTLTSRISPDQTISTSVTSNSQAFRQLAQAYTMIADLGTQNLNASAYAAVTSEARNALTSAIANLINMQAGVGLAQADITNATAQISAQLNILSAQAGDLENINSYEVATRISNLQTQLETSYALTSRLQRLALVQYL
jgi:flagellar hook-associated protein 3 FlgL